MLGRFLEILAKFFAPQPGEKAVLNAAGYVVAAEPLQPTVDMAKAQLVLHRVTELTTAVAEEVGQHQDNIKTINTKLSVVAQGDATAVAELVCKLVAANQELQGRLERAELKLQAHSRQLQDVAVVARTDGLTNLMNRRALDEELQRCQNDLKRRGRSAALLMLDVDHFKQFNDTYGHVAGDRALVHVADVLRTQSRETDIVARFGGEEFALIFQGTTAAAVRQRAEEARAAIGAAPVFFEGREARVTACSGLAEIVAGEELTAWLKRADAALYAAKADGRNCGYWYDEGRLTRNELIPADSPLSASIAEQNSRACREAAAELAAEAFADTTFVREVSQRISEWRRGGETFTVMLARLDGDCAYPQREPPPARQQAIQTACNLARDCVRQKDLLTLWTSEGLAVLLPGAHANDTKVVARRLRAALAQSAGQPAGTEHELSMSMGIAEGIEGNDAQRVLQRAWNALAAAQLAGSGGIYVHDGAKALAVKILTAAR